MEVAEDPSYRVQSEVNLARFTSQFPKTRSRRDPRTLIYNLVCSETNSDPYTLCPLTGPRTALSTCDSKGHSHTWLHTETNLMLGQFSACSSLSGDVPKERCFFLRKSPWSVVYLEVKKSQRGLPTNKAECLGQLPRKQMRGAEQSAEIRSRPQLLHRALHRASGQRWLPQDVLEPIRRHISSGRSQSLCHQLCWREQL